MKKRSRRERLLFFMQNYLLTNCMQCILVAGPPACAAAQILPQNPLKVKFFQKNISQIFISKSQNFCATLPNLIVHNLMQSPTYLPSRLMGKTL